MTISIVGLSSNTINTSASQGAAVFDARNPLSTLQNKESSAVAQLSALGQVRASLSDLQSKAGALKIFSKSPTFADFQVVVQGFVQSVNSLSKNLSALTSKQSALNADSRSGQALNSVSKAISSANESGLSSFQKMGISQQANGTFFINQKQLEKSFQDNRTGVLSAISDLANRVTQAADKQIPTNGSIGKKVNDLSARVNVLENTRSSAQSHLETQKTSPQSLPANTGGYAVRNAVATYSSVASL